MRCVIQVRRSFDIGGQHFVVRLYPQFQISERRAESFTNTGLLVDRLATLGVPKLDPVTSFPDLGGALDAVWNNIDVARPIYESFGKGGMHSACDRPRPIAA
jgi:hypothetical protein